MKKQEPMGWAEREQRRLEVRRTMEGRLLDVAAEMRREGHAVSIVQEPSGEKAPTWTVRVYVDREET